MKQISLCADDFAYSTVISESIIKLAEEKRLSATSCLTNFPAWATTSKNLQTLENPIDLGLHLNFTEGQALNASSQTQFGSINQLITRSFIKRLDRQLIQQEIAAQLDQFQQHLGRAPDFIDGHQHVHQLPVFRDALLAVYQERLDNQVMIRVASNPLLQSIAQARYCPKSIIITLTGALKLKQQLIKLNIPHNQSFSGIYNLEPNNDYAKQFERFLNEVDNGGLIMCHPANRSDQNDDVIAKARQQEFDFFVSEQFLTLLDQQQVKLHRLNQLTT